MQDLESVPRILIVGGTGFIGRHVIDRASTLGWDITSISRQKTSGASCKREVAVDISDKKSLEEALSGTTFDYVINCGGYVCHDLFWQGGRKVLDDHFAGLLNLVEVLDRRTLKAFINVGSSDEYGNTTAPQIESQREAPISSYSLGKVAATHFLQMLRRTENFPAITLRLFLAYGPGQAQNRFLPQVILGCLKGRSFPVSEGRQLRDFCYIQDVVDAMFLALENQAALGEVINIASGRPITIREVVENVQALIGRGRPEFGGVPYRPGESMALYAEISKAEAILGWKPQMDLLSGLEKTIQWLEAQL